MRNILLALLLANILYFMWGKFVETPEENGVALVDEDDLGASLEIAEPVLPEGDGAADAALGKESELAAAVGRSCLTVGPFRAATDADGALAELESDGLRASLRTTEAPVFVGHWVQVRNVPSRNAGNEMLAQLQEGGLGDAYMVETEDEGLKISLGLFGEVDRAERVELQAKSLGFDVGVTQRTRNAMVTFVDVGLPPGKGAGSIIQQYGEDRVLLREAATCPR